MAIQPVQLNGIVITQGSDWSLELGLYDAGVPVNLSSYSAKMSFVKQFGDSPFVTLTEGSGITLNSPTGNIALSITGSDSSDWEFSESDWVREGIWEYAYLYTDIDLYDEDGTFTVFYGQAKVRREVTLP